MELFFDTIIEVRLLQCLRKAIIPDDLQIPYSIVFIGNNKPTTFQQSHQVCLWHIMFHEVR